VAKKGISLCTNPTAHYKGVEELLETIATRSNKARGDVVIAYEEGISVYAVRAWLSRPIPKKHWRTLSRLSGKPVDAIASIATSYFEHELF
jgi:hypothetical protein